MREPGFHHRLGILRPTTLFVAGVLLFVALGCGEKNSPAEAPRAAVWSWPAVEGATTYRVQAWSGHRLLFEESSRDTILTLTPSLERAVQPFAGRVELEVRAWNGRGERQGEVWRESIDTVGKP